MVDPDVDCPKGIDVDDASRGPETGNLHIRMVDGSIEILPGITGPNAFMDEIARSGMHGWLVINDEQANRVTRLINKLNIAQLWVE